jgi:hypothetical protein
MNEHEMSDYFLYKHYAQAFHKEIKKVLSQGALRYIEGHGYGDNLVALIASYEKFEKARCEKFKQQVVDVWEHELKMNPKCKWDSCEENRVMYSFFCEAHTIELLKNPEAIFFGSQTGKEDS